MVGGSLSSEQHQVLESGLVVPNVGENGPTGIIKYRPIVVKELENVEERQVTIYRSSTPYTWISMTLQEGKNREIRNILSSLGVKIARLVRVAYGPWKLGSMKRGDIEEIPEGEIKVEMERIGYQVHQLKWT
jgi:16S rRNA U516 pseudouridylate synthase RsuA-like enzyme